MYLIMELQNNVEEFIALINHQYNQQQKTTLGLEEKIMYQIINFSISQDYTNNEFI